MQNCEKCAEMFPKKQKNAQIPLKNRSSARKCWKCKIMLQVRKSTEKEHSAIGTGQAAIEMFYLLLCYYQMKGTKVDQVPWECN